METISCLKVLHRVLEIAEKNKDSNLTKWAHLELGGYDLSNKHLTNDMTIPQYREVPGEYCDANGRPIVIRDPRLGFIYTRRLGNSVVELEHLYKKDCTLSIKDVNMHKIIYDNLGVEVSEFVINSISIAGILNSIKEEAISRSSKYIGRRELMLVESEKKDDKVNGTPAWLWNNLTLTVWLKFIGLLLFMLSLGIFMAGIGPIRSVLRYIPYYRTNLMVTPEVVEVIKKNISDLTQQHQLILAKLHDRQIYEEKLSSDVKLKMNDRNIHKEALLRLRNMIEQENKEYSEKIQRMKSLLD